MSRFLFLINKSIGHIYKRPLAALGSFLALLLLFLLFDLVWISSLTARDYYARLLLDIDMEVFLDDSLPDSTIQTIRQSIEKQSGVARVDYISKDDARVRLNDLMGIDLLEGLDGNPLPRSLIISFNENSLSSRTLDEFKGTLRKYGGITEIFYARQWLEKAESARALIVKMLIFLGIIILLAVVLNLTHFIRLSLRTRGNEIAQLQLLGAQKYFISFPYIFEGIFYSFVAAVAGWLLIYYGAAYPAFRNIDIIYPSNIQMLYFYAISIIVGLSGGYLGARRSK